MFTPRLLQWGFWAMSRASQTEQNIQQPLRMCPLFQDAYLMQNRSFNFQEGRVATQCSDRNAGCGTGVSGR
jgi:hypothetical protein